MASAHRYSAISFDVGYTLIEPCQEAPEIVAALLAEHNIYPEPSVLRAAHGRAEERFLADYFRPLNETWTADRHINRFYVGYYTQFLAELGLTQHHDQASTLIIQRYLDPTNWQLYPGVLETLAELHEAGYRLGATSDWGSGLTRILHRLGLSRYLDWALISGSIGFAKPSPQFYRLVVLRAAVPATQILHVGDSYYADVRGARTVGMDALLLDWRRRDWPQLDVPVIHALADLPAYLATRQ